MSMIFYTKHTDNISKSCWDVSAWINRQATGALATVLIGCSVHTPLAGAQFPAQAFFYDLIQEPGRTLFHDQNDNLGFMRADSIVDR